MIQGVNNVGGVVLAQLFPSAVRPAEAVSNVVPLRPQVSVTASEVLVTARGHDKFDRVLTKFGIPYQTFDRSTENLNLEGVRYLFVGCGNRLAEGNADKVARWVEAGGFLLCSDFMLYHLLERSFRDEEGHPLVRFRPEMTAQSRFLTDVSEADRKDPATRFLLSFEHPDSWTVSNSAYPITIDRPDRVKVLARSWPMGQAFEGADALAIRFAYGRGEVLHLMAHWYDQHFEPDPSSPPSSGERTAHRTMIFDKPPDPSKF